MAATSATSKFKIVVIPADEEGCRFYLEHYKPFRLASLQRDAHAFGSTYAREIAFDDEAWLGRIKNPLATTFVALQRDDDRVVASTALIGPLPSGGPPGNPYQAVAAGHSDDGRDERAGDEPLRFEMAAVYTCPEARGQGLAKALIARATDEARSRARARGRHLALAVVVYADNAAAISVYERCGFARSPEGPNPVFNTLKNSSEVQLEMHYRGAV
ncbi:acyl-CoA N-acyltransferase [Xylaria palmicola]|nr:acyl-CoA N-acyltransferase [Xylaria palmicola]